MIDCKEMYASYTNTVAERPPQPVNSPEARVPDPTTMRDNMLTRMAMATPGGPRFSDPGRKPDPLPAFDPAQAFAIGHKAYRQIFASPLPTPFNISQDLGRRASVIREALDRGERVVLTAGGKELAVYEPEPGAVVAAFLRRNFGTAGHVTDAMLDAAQSFLPDVDREDLRLTIEAALIQEKRS